LDRKIDVYEAMVSKIVALLECDGDEFDHGQLYFDYAEERYRVQGADDYDGASFTGHNRSGTADETRNNAPANIFQRIVRWFGS
jgi:hypothetical protein